MADDSILISSGSTGSMDTSGSSDSSSGKDSSGGLGKYAGIATAGAGSLFSLYFASQAAAAQEKAQNKSIELYNNQIIKNNAQQLTSLGLQVSQIRAKTAEQLFNLSTQADVEEGQVSLSAAATDTIGTSVKDTLSNVDVQVSKAEGTINLNTQLTNDAVQAQIKSITASSENNLQEYIYGSQEAASWKALGSGITSVAGAAIGLL